MLIGLLVEQPARRDEARTLRTRLRCGAVLAAAAALALPVSPVLAVDQPPDVAAARDAAYDDYGASVDPALAVPLDWSGSVESCDPGAPSAQAQDATLQVLSYVRRISGLAPVDLDPALSAQAQSAALIMQAQGALSHDPPPDWACWTQEGNDAAGRSNLALGFSGAAAMLGYMEDPGSSNTAVGHRRWILYPPQRTMGSGSTTGANALIVFGGQDHSDAGPDWVPWPAAGHFPVQLEPGGRWSLSAAVDTDFASASVSVKRDGAELPVQLEPVVEGYGKDTLVWQLDPGVTTGQADQVFTVTVSGMQQGDEVVSHSWTTTLFDAHIDARQTVSFAPLSDGRYGDVAELDATASSGLPVRFTSSTPDVCVIEAGTVRSTGIGTCTVAADQRGDEIRRPAPTVTRAFTVAPRPVVIRPDDAVRHIGESDPAFSVGFNGLAPGETVETSDIAGAPDCTSSAERQSLLGTYAIDCALGSLSSEHYSFTTMPGVLTVVGPRTIASSCPSDRVPANRFEDVMTASTHEFAISCLVWWEVTTGRTSTTYAPADGVTRDAMAAFVARAILKAQPGALPDDPPDAFTDDDASVHAKAIDQLAAAGIVGGTGSGQYSPGRIVTRGQMATFLANAARYVGGEALPSGEDAFTDDDASVFQGDINRVAHAGLASGRGGGLYAPLEPVQRDQMGSFLARLLALFVDDGAGLPD